MAEVILCKLCGKRRARRACPAVGADICTLCCGTEREVTLSCPLDCGFLREAHKHEKPVLAEREESREVDEELDEDFLRTHEELLLSSIYSLLNAALRTPGAVDTDVLDALAALIKTFQTAESGLLYQTVPENLIAARVQRHFSASLADFAKALDAASRPRDADILRILTFLQTLGRHNMNGRPKGRMFVDVLRQMVPDIGVDERAPSIIL